MAVLADHCQGSNDQQRKQMNSRIGKNERRKKRKGKKNQKIFKILVKIAYISKIQTKLVRRIILINCQKV